MAEPFGSFGDFWPFYVAEHLKPSTRRLHFVGTTLVLASLLLAALDSAWWLLAAPLAGYGFAWAGHFFFEKNRPATFTYPLWSLEGDFRMFGLMLLGRMRPEIDRAVTLYPEAAARAGLATSGPRPAS